MKMKFIIIALLFIFSGMISICQALTVNLLSNPGFETGTTEGWTILGDFLGIKTDGEYYVYGYHAFWNEVYQGQFSAAGGNYNGRPPLQFSQEITVVPNSKIALGYFYTVSYPANSSYDPCSIFRIYTNDQLLVEKRSKVWLGTWYNISTFYMVQPNETSIRITFEHIHIGSGGGNTLGFSFDNFYAIPIPVSCSEPIPDDLNGDCKVDFMDFCLFALEWTGNKDLTSLAGLCDSWLECNLDPPEFCWQ